MAVGEQAEQDELERVALADDGPLDLVQDPPGELADLVQRHARVRAHLPQSLQCVDRALDLLQPSTGRVVVGRARARPGGRRPTRRGRAAPRPGRPRLRARRRCARGGSRRSRGRSGAAGSGRRTRSRVAISSSRSSRARSATRSLLAARRPQRDLELRLGRRCRTTSRSRVASKATAIAPRSSTNASAARFESSGRTAIATPSPTAPSSAADRRPDEGTPLDHAAAASARSSSRTETSASIASSFMPRSISCGLNFARSNSAVSRDDRLGARVQELAQDAAEVLERRLGDEARQPGARERLAPSARRSRSRPGARPARRRGPRATSSRTAESCAASSAWVGPRRGGVRKKSTYADDAGSDARDREDDDRRQPVERHRRAELVRLFRLSVRAGPGDERLLALLVVMTRVVAEGRDRDRIEEEHESDQESDARGTALLLIRRRVERGTRRRPRARPAG